MSRGSATSVAFATPLRFSRAAFPSAAFTLASRRDLPPRMSSAFAVALEHLARDPLLFLHAPDAGCSECDEARRSTAEVA